MFKKRWTDQEILDAIRRWAEEHGRAPGWNDWRIAGPEDWHPASSTVRSRCGSWSEALIMAGLEPTACPEHKQRFDREEAREFARQGLTYTAIAALLGVSDTSIARALGPRPKTPRKPRNAEERREVRVAALRRALEKNN